MLGPFPTWVTMESVEVESLYSDSPFLLHFCGFGEIKFTSTHITHFFFFYVFFLSMAFLMIHRELIPQTMTYLVKQIQIRMSVKEARSERGSTGKGGDFR